MINQNALFDMSYGMYVVATEYEQKNYGCLIDTVMQQTQVPVIISISLNKKTYTSQMIEKSRKFALSVLSKQTKPDVYQTFGFSTSKEVDKFRNFSYDVLASHNPVLKEHVCTYVDCEVIDSKEIGEYVIFFGKVLLARKVSEEVPITYHEYHQFTKDTICNKEENNMNELQFYYCEMCKNLTVVVNKGMGIMSCCGKPMIKLEPNTVDAASEKHLPVGSIENGILTVTIGSVAHPMDTDHYIEWIYVVTEDGTVMKKPLSPDTKPEATFDVRDAKKVDIYAYCNKHGLWKTTIE